MILARRRFLSLVSAPFIVAAANIMPVKALAEADEPYRIRYGGIDIILDGRPVCLQRDPRMSQLVIDLITSRIEAAEKKFAPMRGPDIIKARFSKWVSLGGSPAHA